MKQKKILKRVIYLITFLLTVAYTIYRICFTLPIHIGAVAMIFGVIVLLTETWESYEFFIYYLNALRYDEKSPKVPDVPTNANYPDIDVFVATLNESEALLEQTLTACKNMEYPEKNKIHIYLCDDGNRSRMKELADKLHVNYITRTNNKNAKAGNYNHALAQTNSPYIVFFDADMAPTPNFLKITVPFFLSKKYKKLGFVQLPQSFKNPDIYQSRFHLENKLPFDQEYFYNTLQIAKNKTNTVVFCGTNAMMSRAALNEVHGFATGTISEDIATGMLLENAGYQGVAINNIEAYGTSVNDFTGFFKQRTRWARGCIQMAQKYKISKCKGFSLKQKLEYKLCVSYWYFGIRRLVYLITPLLFSIFGLTIINCDLKVFLAFWLPTYLLKRFMIDFLEHHQRSTTWTTIYETILAPVMALQTIREKIGLGSTKFEVTPKGTASNKMSKLNLKVLLFHLIMLALNLTGAILSILRLNGSSLMIYIIPIIWTLSNSFYLLIATIFDLRYKKRECPNFVPNKVRTYWA